MRRFTVSFLLLAALVFSQSLPPGVQKVTSVEGITEYAYPNGLHVLLFPDPSNPKVTVNVTYLVGSRHEGYGETGMAHLLEHLMFRETATRSNIKQELTAHVGNNWNGTTSYDRTNYFETANATADNLHWAIQLEADRMVNARIDQKNLDAEMTVVRNEFESGENSPDRILEQRTLEAAYAWHNYGKSPIGNRSDIEHVPILKLAAFYQKYYQPDNALLTIAGKFDETQTLAWIAEAFAPLPRPQRTLDSTYTLEPTQDGERFVALRRVGDTQSIRVLYHIPAGSHPDTAVAEVLTGVLGDTPSGRLYKALVENKKAVSANMGTEEMHDPGFVMATVRLREDQSLDDARQTLISTIENLASEPPSEQEVDRAKTRILKQFELLMTNTQSLALQLSDWASFGDWRLLFLMRDRIKTVTPQDVQRVAKTYLKESNRTVAEFIPTKTPDRAEIPQVTDIAAELKNFKGGAAISQGEAFDPSPANIESRIVRSRLPGGVKLSLLSKKTRGGTVDVALTIRFGDEKALFGKEIAADMAGGLLMRGTRNKTRQQIQDEIDRLKAQLIVTGGAASATASIRTTEANLPDALRLAVEILREPAFPEREFDQLRQQRIAGVEASRSDPRALASIALQKRLNPFPRGDVRYVSTAEEEIEDLQKTTLDDVRKFYQQFYGASEGELSVVGQFDPAATQKLVSDLLANWKSPSRYDRIVTPYSKTEPVKQRIETPDKQNAMFLAAMAVRMSDEDPDYPAMVLGNYILGGSGGSRLFSRIRNKEGLSYGVSSQFGAPTKEDRATFSASIISAPQNAPKAEASFLDELARTARDGFTAGEVAEAKKSLLESQVVARSQDQNLTRLLGNRQRFDRTMKFDEELEARIAALTTEQVSAAFRRHIDPAGLVVIEAGDFKKAGVFQ